MIVALVSDPHLRAAVRLAAHPEEDVIVDHDLAVRALELGCPRVVLRTAGGVGAPTTRRWVQGVRTVALTDAVLARWEAQRREAQIRLARVDFLAARLGEILEREPDEVTWVDRTLAELGRAAGAPLPDPLRGFVRRILEFPSHYRDLYPLAESCGLSRGALKARFRRRTLASPSTYLRWLRLIASANALADRSVTVAEAAQRLGFTSDGNLCRSMSSLTGLTPTEARTVRGWNRILITFAWKHLGDDALEAWRGLDDLFVARRAA